ncbi:MAG: HAD family hydrolase [Bacteroidota bacterium]|jgi:epoxide hydrolase-like predicted phosphatase|nr:HAD family phosphatase [Algoriphagus sp.]
MKIRPDLELIVFDLGNVLIDIDYAKAMSTMKSVIPIHLHPKVDQCYSAEFHKAYERGELDSSTFRNEFRNYFEQYWSDDEVDALWNSLLGSLPAYRLDLIRQLKTHFQVAILSNTNEIHIHAVEDMLAKEYGMDNFASLFDWVFYSHQVGLAKPDQAIYQHLVDTVGVDPSQILFFDDLAANIEGAAALGIQSIRVEGPHTLLDFFADVYH